MSVMISYYYTNEYNHRSLKIIVFYQWFTAVAPQVMEIQQKQFISRKIMIDFAESKSWITRLDALLSRPAVWHERAYLSSFTLCLPGCFCVSSLSNSIYFKHASSSYMALHSKLTSQRQSTRVRHFAICGKGLLPRWQESFILSCRTE